MEDLKYESRLWLRRMRPVCVILGVLLLTVYVGTYCHLRSRGLAEAKRYHGEGLLHVSSDELFQDYDEDRYDALMMTHFNRASFFAPINWVDRTFCGGQGRVSGFMRWSKTERPSVAP